MEIIRKIIHVDMDAFYASVEQRDNPKLKGKPVVISKDPNHKGVVTTCSYEARAYGVHSAMSAQKAYSLCPRAIFIPPRIGYYREVSSKIMKIFYRFTDNIEPLSCDEAFLDVTDNKVNIKSATIIAKLIKESIYSELGLTASAGVSYNKFIAKLASDFQKPSGLTVVPPYKAEEFLSNMPISKFFGVGKVTKEKMYSVGIFTGEDLKARSKEELINLFGKKGLILYKNVRGIDEAKVRSHIKRKSLGKEQTYSSYIKDGEEILEELKKIAISVSSSLKYHSVSGKTVKLKIKFDDFKGVTKQKSYLHYINEYREIYDGALKLFKEIDIKKKKIRLLGITLSNLKEDMTKDKKYHQISIDELRF